MNAGITKKHFAWILSSLCMTATLLAASAQSASLVWTNSPPGNSTWSTSPTDTNWSGNFFTNGDEVTFGDTGVGPIAIPANVTQTGMLVNHTSGTYTFTGDGSIGGTGALTKTGAGVLVFENGANLTGINTFSGITFDGGEIVFDNLNRNQLGTGTINVTSNSILTFTRGDTNGAVINNPMTIGDGLTMTFRRAGSQPTPNYAGKISGNADLVFDKPTGLGGNSWTISNATNDFTGTITIIGGAAAATFSNEGSLGNATNITLNGGGLIFDASVVGAGRTVNVVGGGTLGSSGGMFQGLVTGAGISVNNLGLDNANNSHASTFNNQGTLRVGVPGSLGSGTLSYTSNPNNFLVFVDPVGGTFSNTISMSSGDNRTLEVTNAGASINWTGNITDAATPDTNYTVTKLGPGTFATTNWSVIRRLQVNEGRFLINDSTTANLGNIIVAPGATFGGDGHLVFATGKSLTVNGTLQPGNNDAGTLTVQGPLNLTSTAILDFQLGSLGNDLIAVDGDLVLDGSLQVSPLGLFGQEGDSYTLFTYTGMLDDQGLELIGMPYGVLDFSNPGFVNLLFPVPIPEPATGWLMGLSLLAFGRKLRRQRK